MKEREQFGSRLGFILVSAGCAIGLGNVWKFPYICGMYGGAAFILMYVIFLALLGLPILICEFSVGRASRKGIGKAFDVLEKNGTHWHHLKWMGYNRFIYTYDVLYYGRRMDVIFMHTSNCLVN